MMAKRDAQEQVGSDWLDHLRKNGIEELRRDDPLRSETNSLCRRVRRRIIDTLYEALEELSTEERRLRDTYGSSPRIVPLPDDLRGDSRDSEDLNTLFWDAIEDFRREAVLYSLEIVERNSSEPAAPSEPLRMLIESHYC